MKAPIIHSAKSNSLLQYFACCLLATAVLLWFGVKTGANPRQFLAESTRARVLDHSPTPEPDIRYRELPADQVTFWVDGLILFGDTVSVRGTLAVNPWPGLGPAFNGNSCLLCHSQPAIGGSSPAQNPQIGIANLDGATNTIPPFLTSAGPALEARSSTTLTVLLMAACTTCLRSPDA